VDEVWQLGTRCTVQLSGDEESTPDGPRQSEFRYAVEMSVVQDIVANAEGQLRRANPSQLLQAFLFYYDHDAFIDFER
jgi:hypothetical protein